MDADNSKKSDDGTRPKGTKQLEKEREKRKSVR